MPFIVTADIRLRVEDDQAQNEEQAKVAAIEQFSDYLRYHTWPELLKAQRVEAGKTEHRKEYGEGDIILCPHCGSDDIDCDNMPSAGKCNSCGLEMKTKTVLIWME
ncbi:MAG: hypothetical protein HQ588_02660 [Deltaproteobacteria bacterium]|nr:hypothetical protein [Deltaproteobacteria bacterium]